MKTAFAELTNDQKAFIENAEFHPVFVTGEQVKEVSEVLELDGKNFEELTALRNAVVKHLVDLKGRKRDAGDWAEFDKLSINISALVAVVDDRLYS